MILMTAKLDTPLGLLQLTAGEHGLREIAFKEPVASHVSFAQDPRTLASWKLPTDARVRAQLMLVPEHLMDDELTSAGLMGVEPKSQCQIKQQPQLCHVSDMVLRKAKVSPAEVSRHCQAISLLLQDACTQLTEYFAKQRSHFTLALAPVGTPFQQQVWLALQHIQHGDTCSYGDIANRIANPKAVRAVGAANGKNPLAIVVPCHRVIGHSRQMTGYAGGLARKVWLLQHEAS